LTETSAIIKTYLRKRDANHRSRVARRRHRRRRSQLHAVVVNANNGGVGGKVACNDGGARRRRTRAHQQRASVDVAIDAAAARDDIDGENALFGALCAALCNGASAVHVRAGAIDNGGAFVGAAAAAVDAALIAVALLVVAARRVDVRY
jgi:hypothetical protein